jgi:hypothetical protein
MSSQELRSVLCCNTPRSQVSAGWPSLAISIRSFGGGKGITTELNVVNNMASNHSYWIGEPCDPQFHNLTGEGGNVTSDPLIT